MYLEQKYLLLASSQLSKFKKKSNSLFNFRCPYCGDSQKNKTKARGYVFLKENSLIYKCHNCGVGASLPNLLKFLDVKLYNEFMTEKFRDQPKQLEDELKPSVKELLRDSQSKLRSIKKISQLPIDHVARKFCDMRMIPNNKHYLLYYTSHFYKFVNTLITNKFPSIKNDHPRLIIPFFNENNILYAIQGRSLADEFPKYITIKIDEDKDKIYGLEKVDWSRTVYVVEGPIDSLFLDNCIATAQSDLRVANKEVSVLIPDNEPRNLEVVKQIEKYINENYNVVIWPSDIKEKDINEMIMSGKTERDIKDTIAQNTFNGLLAKTKLSQWKKV
tara:strand:- start:9774 stop:10766 length:993 start_codon:yes stop_codon:yes gene_type:complete